MNNNALDKTDYRILELLQQDCQLPDKVIANKLNLSRTPVSVRIKRLEDEGYIRRYVALLDPRKVGVGLIAYTQVQIKSHSREVLDAFISEVTQIPEVTECSHVSGKFDFLLKILVKDMDEYNNLLIRKLATLTGVDTMESLFVMSQPKFDTFIPLTNKQ